MSGLTPERWQLLAPLLDRILEAPDEQRPDLAAALAGDDPGLQAELAALVAAAGAGGGILDRSADEYVRSVIDESVPKGAAAEGQRVRTCPDCKAENDAAAEVCFTCGKTLVASPTAITRGTLIADRYEILSPLGRGGMGAVYKAHDRVLDETVAVKTLRADIAREEEGARRFRSEIKLARKVRHRNVCAIHEYGESGGLNYIAMELIDGIDLRQLIRDSGGLPQREAFEVAIEVTSGLQAIHNAGIIHRDLKTSNIMKDRSGRVRVMDFGIAKQFGSESTLGGRVVGTPEYMSPEQARGRKLDFSSDIYSLGIVIYEIFAGRVPFQGETPIATILMHLQEAPRLDGAGSEGIPPTLAPVLRRALAKEPSERFATARELAEALQAARAAAGPAPDAGSGARAGSGATPMARGDVRRVDAPGPRRARGAPGRPVLVAVAGGLLLAAVAFLVAQGRRSGPAVSPVTSGALATPPTTASHSDPALPSAGSPSRPTLASVPPTLERSPGETDRPALDSTRARSPAARPAGSRQPLPKAGTPSAGTTALPAAAATPAADSARPDATPSPPSTTRPVAPPPDNASPLPSVQRQTAAATQRGDLAEPGPGVMPPQLVGRPEPVYPVLAKRLKRQARVLIRALVDENGKIVRAEVAEGDSSRLGFDEAALEAAYKTIYKPALKDGVPVKMWIELPVTFRP